MEFHNTVEDTVIARVSEIFDALESKENPEKFCTCNQCRTDIICYVLNRMPPNYIISNRGASRFKWESFEKQQQLADIAAMIHDGLRRVNHNQRPNFNHFTEEGKADSGSRYPVFNIPTIIGRIFNGNNFAPLADVDVELLYEGELAQMKDANWQNPCRIVPHNDGTFSFWPAPVKASELDEQKVINYSIRVTDPEYETLIHFFQVTVTSEIEASRSFTIGRTFKLPDLYMFPPGEDEQDW